MRKESGNPVDAFGPMAEEAYLNVLRTAEGFAESFVRLFKSFGITSAQYNVLRILRGAGPAGLPCQEIGERLVNRVPDVTRLVDRVEQAGWAERHRSTEDRRVVRVRITDTGRELLNEIDAPLLALHRTNLGHLSQEELLELNRLLVKARSGISKQEVAS